ncbi:response regulator receiver protein [Halorubrum sp. GN11_10-6_MGM]|uniref:response regulator receiver protein n=1 Tax=Halorubrum sp. GN11_10-6_MGM TaxID=2518112 RepID=UPI0010F612E1|nr:response regulator receiver protein [Halorubrum sp. GN11_10-6_MGM]TKX75199.1 response regulator receiver protein [Halorubrum sp. GN11_10-6_MGM]
MTGVELPVSTVVVCEANRTRADLYGLWLDAYEPRRALTSAQFAEAFDAGVAVLVLDDSFGDGSAEAVVERVRSEAAHCRVIGIREASDADDPSAYDRDLTRPVFEADLTDCVETLLYRANYHLLLDKYYRTTVLISAYEWRTGDEGSPAADSPDAERYDRLRDRAERLQGYLNDIRPAMTDEDVRAVAEGIAVADAEPADAEPADAAGGKSGESKYRPDECARCGTDWRGSNGSEAPATKLGAYVWRCGSCGHVDMRADPNHRHVSSFRR